MLECHLVYWPEMYGAKKPYWLFNANHNPTDENSLRILGKFSDHADALAWMERHQGNLINPHAQRTDLGLSFELWEIPAYTNTPIPAALGMWLINSREADHF